MLGGEEGGLSGVAKSPCFRFQRRFRVAVPHAVGAGIGALPVGRIVGVLGRLSQRVDACSNLTLALRFSWF